MKRVKKVANLIGKNCEIGKFGCSGEFGEFDSLNFE
jgi:hypothetical protein